MSIVSTAHIENKVDKVFIDPVFESQKYCLVSFTAAKGATPDADGVFGMSKVRGVFQTASEANDRAEWLIRNHDSTSVILTTFVGRPYPVCVDTKKFVEETNSIDMTTKISTTMRDDAKEKRNQDKKAMLEMKEREKTLLEDVSRKNNGASSSSASSNSPTEEDEFEDPHEFYTMLRVKRAHLIYTYNEHIDKLQKMRKALDDCDNAIRLKDASSSEFKESYRKRYEDARSSVGCNFSPDVSQTFMNFLDDDRGLDVILNTV